MLRHMTVVALLMLKRHDTPHHPAGQEHRTASQDYQLFCLIVAQPAAYPHTGIFSETVVHPGRLGAKNRQHKPLCPVFACAVVMEKAAQLISSTLATGQDY